MPASDLLPKLARGDFLLKVHVQLFNRGSFGFWITKVDKDDADKRESSKKEADVRTLQRKRQQCKLELGRILPYCHIQHSACTARQR